MTCLVMFSVTQLFGQVKDRCPTETMPKIGSLPINQRPTFFITLLLSTFRTKPSVPPYWTQYKRSSKNCDEWTSSKSINSGKRIHQDEPRANHPSISYHWWGVLQNWSEALVWCVHPYWYFETDISHILSARIIKASIESLTQDIPIFPYYPKTRSLWVRFRRGRHMLRSSVSCIHELTSRFSLLLL